jgi:hypothetical protein
MPYLVVTVSPEGVNATAVNSKDEARILASKKTLERGCPGRARRQALKERYAA